MGYVTPFFGLSQKFGAVWKLPLKLISTLCATFRGGQSDLVDSGAIHIQIERGQAEHLLHVDVGCSGNLAQPISYLLPELVVRRHVRANNLYVDWRGHSEVKNLRNDIGGLEEKLHSRKASRQFAAQTPNVTCCRMMMFGIQEQSESRHRSCR